jgi:hypothetical protein
MNPDKHYERLWESLEVLDPSGSIYNITLPSVLFTKEGKSVEVLHNETVFIISEQLKPYSILRRIIKT